MNPSTQMNQLLKDDLNHQLVLGILKCPSLTDGYEYNGTAQILTVPLMYPPGVIVDVMLC